MTMASPPPGDVGAGGIGGLAGLGGLGGAASFGGASNTSIDATPGVSATGFDAGVGVLAMTGAGPGTAFLALAGLVSLITGAAMAVTGRKMTTRNTATAGLPDLSHLGARAG